MAVWAAEDQAEVEEEVVEEEEVEEAGNLDEEEIKKMQSDEVCGDSPPCRPHCGTLWVGYNLGSPLFFSPLSTLAV